jgi:hypothetical protein
MCRTLNQLSINPEGQELTSLLYREKAEATARDNVFLGESRAAVLQCIVLLIYAKDGLEIEIGC